MKKVFVFLPLILMLLFSCMQEKPAQQNKESSSTPAVTDSLRQLGITIAAEMQQVLGGALKHAVEDSGVAYALNFCNLHAYPLTDSISALHGVKIKRISHKARNLNNQASDNEMKVIQQFQLSMETGEPAAPVVVERESGYTFFAPIVLQAPLCLKCHGEPEKEIASEDFILLNMLYPNDKATGFKLNELRGSWRIDFNKTTPAL